jgi:glycosyltransferase involved in cell wall biosynthesis
MEQSTPDNVLLVSNYPSDVGYAWWLMEHFWTLIAEHFEARGGKAFLAYPSITELPESIRKSNIVAVEMDTLGAGTNRRKAIEEFIKTHNIRHIYLTDRPWFNLDYAYMRRAGAKNIVIHDHTPGDRPRVRGLKGLIKSIRNRLPLICADSQLCVSDLMRKRSISNGRIPANRCHVVQNGIPAVELGKSSRQSLLGNLDIPVDSRICITTGRAAPYKRFDFIIDTAAELQRVMPENNLVFLLIGDGPAHSALRDKVIDLKLEKQVRLPGFMANARDILGTADIAMHAALGEGFSLSVVEYMSAGLPVLVPDIPSVKQAIDHGKNGYIFPKDDPSAAAAFIANLLQNEKTRRSMGRLAREKANTRYSLDNCTREFQKACQIVF